MKTLRWAIASPIIGVLFAGSAMAQVTMSPPVQQPNSIQQMGYSTDDPSGYAVADPTATAGTMASPSNAPPAPPATTGGTAATTGGTAATPPTDTSGGTAAADATPPAPSAVTLFHGDWLDCHHLALYGHADVGMGFNPLLPVNRFNGPVAYDDRADELQLNQATFTAERVTKIDNDCGTNFGYRADILYGTDNRFIRCASGSEWDSGWDNGNRFYGLCMPQMYGDLAYNKLLLRFGHFYAPVGFEVANSDGNFFYSHTYQFLYAEPTTLTGGYATYKIKDKLLVNFGLDTGWNEGFQDLNGKPNFFAGFNWTSADKDGKLNVIEELFIGDTQPVPGVDDSTRVLLNTVVNVKLGDKWTYSLETNWAHDSDTFSTATPGPGVVPTAGMGPATWWGFTNYLIYNINDCWGFGFRQEYFEDLDGAVVTQVGPATIAEPGSKWNDITLGLNWKPNLNVTMRSEIRWDWASNSATGPNDKPFDSGFSNGQFLWGNDVVVKY